MSDVLRVFSMTLTTATPGPLINFFLWSVKLRKLAASRWPTGSGQTLQPTGNLVHEAWLRLTGDEYKQWDSRAHFFGAAAEAMRRILIENARRKRAIRHGGGQQRVDVSPTWNLPAR